MRFPRIRFVREKALVASPSVVEAVANRQTNFFVGLGGSNQAINAAYRRGLSASYGWMYANQPAVRSVVDFIARNVSQLPLKLYERVGETERRKADDHPAAQSLEVPDGRTPEDQWLFRFLVDFLVYDNAFALKFRPSAGEILTLVRLPPAQVVVSGGRFTPDFYRVHRIDGSYFDVLPEDIVHWYGSNPDDPLLGLSKLETLRQILVEDSVSQTTSVELMKNGLKGGHIERPLDAPEWSQEAQDRFREGWANQAKGSPRKTPVLEEGMKYVQDAISPKDAEMLAGRRFTVEEVARVYGVPPGVLGLDPSSDLAEQRKQVYADVLPPYTKPLACQFDVDLLRAEYDDPDYYFEFDLNEKLRGDPVQRFQAITAAVGAPWLLRNEARALENRPPIDGGDEVITPLNVLVGDNPKPAPNVMAPQDPNKPPQDGSYREQPKALPEQKQLLLHPRRKADMERQRRYIDEAQGLFERYYRRQEQTLVRKGQKAADSERWNSQLSTDIHKLVSSIVEREGGVYAARLGHHDFDMRRVENYLKAMAEGAAEGVNAATQSDIEDIGVRDALDRARSTRAAIAGVSIGTRATFFARQEAAKQAPDAELRRQVWIADTDRHAELDGVAVPLGDDWGGIEPGSEPNCACTAVIE